MEWEAWLTLAGTAVMVVAMARGVASPDLVLLAGLTVFVATGVLPVADAFVGFSNHGMLSVAALFVVAAGVRETGGLDAVLRRVLGRPRRLAEAQLRMMLPVAAVSSLVNNTPVVAMMVPVVVDWARRTGLPASRLLIPLSYASILGGTCTLIGTSTNLVVYGMLRDHAPDAEIGMFDIAWLGVPALLVGLGYVLLAARRLPDRAGAAELAERPREYTVAMRVLEGSVVVGQTIEEAGLRHLPGLFLVEIERDGTITPAVGPDTRLRADDHLLFVGIVESVIDLRRIPGLVPATDQVDKLTTPRPGRTLIEAVVGVASSLQGKSVRALGFRTRYGAAIIAVHRNGARVSGKIGDIVLLAGDTLLLEAAESFLKRYRNDSSFALVTAVEGSRPPALEKAPIAIGILVVMVTLTTLEIVPLLVSSLIAAGAMLATRCLTGPDARRSLDVSTLVTIAAAFGVGAALERSGAAGAVARILVDVAAPYGHVAILAAIYVATMLLTELITNNAAAALTFPLVVAVCESSGLPLIPAALVTMMAASASFSTPIGYQTNLMVYGPGGYRFGDFLRFGIPLQLVLGVVVVGVAAALWL
ncbi:MAG: SLC13 family permease [Sandaracinaceae bacterium]|nr:SLC13 family permease [Sandaracinaceae bacterium]